jgi:hypothetical protein
MPVHIVKLCVGASSVSDLEEWQTARLAEQAKSRQPLQLRHVTRMFPKNKDGVLDGGSLYWVIEGRIRVRQRILDLTPVEGDDGIRRCGIVFAPELILVRPTPRRPFQGWRYLAAEDAPPDLSGVGEADGVAAMPAEMQAELAALGLL